MADRPCYFQQAAWACAVHVSLRTQGAWHASRCCTGSVAVVHCSGNVLHAEHAWSARDVERALFSAAAEGMQPRAEPAVTGGKRKRELQK